MKCFELWMSKEEQMLLQSILDELVSSASHHDRPQTVGMRIRITLPDEFRLRELASRLRKEL